MATVSLPYTLQAGQPENVNQLVANLDALVAGVNTVDTAQLASGSVTQAKLASGVYAPIGGIMQYAGSSAPTNWVLCDGSAISRATYADLFTALSTTYGSGDGSTTFNVPDLRGRIAVGKGTNADVDALGENDGVAVADRTPKHYHTLTTGRGGQFASHENSGATGNSSFYTTSTVTTGQKLFATTVSGMQTSGNTSNVNTPAFIVVNYIIRAL
jgi:microcystin-dependent protein